MRRSSRFRASTLLLAVTLSAVPVFARGHEAKPRVEVHGIFGSLWHSLGGLLPALTKGRGTIDPDGATTAPAGSQDGRAGMDPDG